MLRIVVQKAKRQNAINRENKARTHTHMSSFCFDHTTQIFRVRTFYEILSVWHSVRYAFDLLCWQKYGARKIRTRIVAPLDNLWADIDFKPCETGLSLTIELETKLKISLFRMNNCKGFVAEPEMMKHVCGLFFHFTCVVQMCNSILVGAVCSRSSMTKKHSYNYSHNR